MPDENYNQAVAHLQRGELPLAEACCNRLLQSHPEHPQALHLAAAIASQQGKLNIAEKFLRQAVEREPGFFQAWHDLAGLLVHTQRPADAIDCYQQMVQLQPGTAGVYVDLGNAQLILGQRQQALQNFSKAVELMPQVDTGHNNIGVVLNQLNRFTEAVAAFDKALAINPQYADALSGRAVAHMALRQFDTALDDIDNAIALDPQQASFHLNKSFCLLLQGKFEQGWPELEWRLRKSQAVTALGINLPEYTGQHDLSGKTLLLVPDQGLGDLIQLARYVPLLAERGARVVAVVQPALKPLFTTVSGMQQVLAWGEALPAADYYCAWMSLPMVFSTTLDTIPAPKSYLYASDEKRAVWQQRLGDKNSTRIGIVWTGGTDHLNDHNRSLRLAPLLEALGSEVELVSLQKEIRDNDKPVLEQNTQLKHVGEQLIDFSDTAAIIAQLDLVISVDTSVAHLAGALGVPVWVLIADPPDWRWMHDRSDSPWYPSMQLFRQQTAGQWDTVFNEIAKAIKQISERSQK